MKQKSIEKFIRSSVKPLALVTLSVLLFSVPRSAPVRSEQQALDLLPYTAVPELPSAPPAADAPPSDTPAPAAPADDAAALRALWGLDPLPSAAQTPAPFSLTAETSPSPADGASGCDQHTVDVSVNGTAVEMTLFDYLIGVIAAEMPASYDPEALKAQAVAARTFTLKHMVGEARCKSGCTICSDCRCCQAFADDAAMHRNWGSRFEDCYNKIRDAVLATSGMVMTSGGKLVNALYHSNSGGRTEDCEAVFAVAVPYLVSVESAGEEDSPEFRAVKTYTKEEFISIINESFPDACMTDPARDVDVWQRTESGRITLIRLGGTVRTGQQLRNALKLHSTNAHFDISGSTVTVTCLGYGHGVGMSQCGANAMANGGADWREILAHYYTGVELVHYGLDLTADENASTP